MKPVTDKQNKLLAFIRSCDIPPTIREMAAAMGIKNHNAVYMQLNSLESKGAITRDKRRARMIRVVDTGETV